MVKEDGKDRRGGEGVVDRLRKMAERSRDMSGNAWSEDRERQRNEVTEKDKNGLR